MSILQSPLPKVARPLFLRLPSAWMSAPKVGAGNGVGGELFGGAALDGESAGHRARVQNVRGDGPQDHGAGHGGDREFVAGQLAYTDGAAHALDIKPLYLPALIPGDQELQAL